MFFAMLASFAAALALLSVPPSLASPPPPPNFPDLVEKILPGVVNISSTTVTSEPAFGMQEFQLFWGMPRERKSTSLGSGFIIDSSGLIFTNYHVVADASEVVVTLLDKRQIRAKLIGKDQKSDLALIKLAGQPANLHPVPMGDSDKVRIAESAFAIGNPFGLAHTVTLGIISAKNRTIGQGPFDNFLQTDASINPGNSGGPLFNTLGEVIGINTVIYSRTGQSGGLGFAIPINEAKKIQADLQRYGRVPRPWLGIVSERMNPQLAAYYRLGTDEGVLIYNMVEDGPADRAGIRQGDIIVEVDGNKTLEPYDVERVLAKRKPGESAKAKLQRGRKKIEISIKLDELPRLDKLPAGII